MQITDSGGSIPLIYLPLNAPLRPWRPLEVIYFVLGMTGELVIVLVVPIVFAGLNHGIVNTSLIGTVPANISAM
jgi:hypothetical protein